VGKIDGQWVGAQLKLDILAVIESAKKQGVSVQRSCFILDINRRRIVRWQGRVGQGLGLEDARPGPREPLHRLLPTERQQVIEFAKQEKYADLSHRILAVTAWELNLFFVSFTTVYRILNAEGLMSLRGCHSPHNGRSLPPVRKELTGANQRWCWDISYLHTFEKGIFLYLYLLLDEYSRKAISWLISWHQDAQAAKRLLDMGLIEENILDLPEEERPEIINDRGRQMKAKPVRKLLRDHAMPQMFARPRTPDDNPFIESAFSTLKRSPGYPGRFLDMEEAQEYFTNYFKWYNEHHYHSGIDYVTPLQAHNGLREKIVAQRQYKFMQQRQWRKKVNQNMQNLPEILLPSLVQTYNLSEPWSVIDP
jgi:transposase InsO family protein